MHEQVEEPESDSRAAIFVRVEQRRKLKLENDCLSFDLRMIFKSAAFSKG